MINIFKIFFLLFLFSLKSYGQLIDTDPAFPQDDQSVIITFNSALGSAGLKDYDGAVYAHTGVITDQSSSLGDWKYVKTNWGENTPETRLTKIGDNLYTLNITPDIRTYYGVPEGEKILQIALVFRSGMEIDGSYLEGKTAEGGDIFVNIYEGSGINVNLSKPGSGYLFMNIGDTLPLHANSINADSIFLFENQQLLASDSGNQIYDTVYAHDYGQYWIKAVAKNSEQSVTDSFYYYVRDAVSVEPLPEGVIEGINYLNQNTVTLCLFAPGKEYAFVIGDFNDWMIDTAYYMKKTPDGNHFWLTVNNLTPGKEYIFQYFVDGKIKIGDPYAEKVSDPWNDHYIDAATYPNMLSYPSTKTRGIATVLQTNQESYNWNHNDFTAPESDELIVYELLVRDYTSKHTFQAVIDSLQYLKTLGINAIELMPVNEFEGNSSWGYNPNYYFAVDKYYGPKEKLKQLIDTCHSMGIAVILDVVYNHSFGTSPYVMLWWDDQNNRPSPTNPFFNPVPKHDYNVGFDMNHESAATRKYISRALKFWLQNYKVDGFRFDLSKGFTQNNTLGDVGAWGKYDATRIYTLNRYADSIWSVNPDTYVILEHFADNNEEKDLSARGMMLWGNLNHQYAEGAMGYNSDFSWISYKTRGWNAPHVVGYMESHDEERLMFKCSQWGNVNEGYNIKEKATFMERASLDAMFFLTIPGPKMIWQFGELGYDISIDFNGRTGEKPIRWDYLNDNDRYNTYLIYKALIDLRSMESDCFQSSDFILNVNKSLKYIYLNDVSMSAAIIGNFDVLKDTVTMSFPHNGIWYDYLSGQEVQVNNNHLFLNLKPGEFHLFTDKQQEIPELVIPPARIDSSYINIQGDFEIYPNPSRGDFQIYLNAEGNVDLYIYDISGRKIGHLVSSGNGKRTVNFSEFGLELNSGIYFCQIHNNDAIATKKFIIY